MSAGNLIVFEALGSVGIVSDEEVLPAGQEELKPKPWFRKTAGWKGEITKKETYSHAGWNKGWGNKKEGAAKDNALREAGEAKIGVNFETAGLYSVKYEGEAKKYGGDEANLRLLTAAGELALMKASLNAKELTGELMVVDGKVEASAASGEWNVSESIRKFFGIKSHPKALPQPKKPLVPMALRLGDIPVHATPLGPGPGSSNVFIGGRPAWRAIVDQHLCALPGGVAHGGGSTAEGEATVLINGYPAARTGDLVLEPGGGPNVIVKGCPTVFIGKPAPLPDPKLIPKKRPKDLPWLIFEDIKVTGDVAKAEAGAALGGGFDLDKGEVKGVAKAGAMFAALKGAISGGLRSGASGPPNTSVWAWRSKVRWARPGPKSRGRLK